MKRKRTLTAMGSLAAVLGWCAFCGCAWSRGPFVKLHHRKNAGHPGNRRKYDLDRVKEKPGSALRGKRIVFLGSSVTYGASSQRVSFVDYLGKQNGSDVIKEAVSGTTLVEEGQDSYIARLRNMGEDHVDLFVCQLSTNDATRKKPLGAVGASTGPDDFDTGTVAGAMEYIIAYAKEKWGCPVMFYTNPRYDSEEYGRMVALLKEIRGRWDIGVIDMWDDEAFNRISEEDRSLYMADSIHPTKAGYLEWWLPYMEDKMERYYRQCGQNSSGRKEM